MERFTKTFILISIINPRPQIKEVKLENFWYELTGVWVIPQDRIANRTIYYIHGGGWSFLQPKNMLKTLEAIAIASKSSVFAIDYRKAPEFPFPTGLSDCVLGYKWLLSQPGVDSKSTIIAGDSAGGNLTLTTTISLINDADPSLIPAGLICISPVTNAEANFPSIQENKKLDPMLNISVEFFQMISYPSAPLWSSLSKFPLISPYHASLETLRKFPPVQIWVAEGEVLRDDSIFMSEKLKSAGVDVDLRIGQNVLHVYPCFLSPPESVHARSEMAKFINRVCGTQIGMNGKKFQISNFQKVFNGNRLPVVVQDKDFFIKVFLLHPSSVSILSN